jgi:hypothetical protein
MQMLLEHFLHARHCVLRALCALPLAVLPAITGTNYCYYYFTVQTDPGMSKALRK